MQIVVGVCGEGGGGDNSQGDTRQEVMTMLENSCSVFSSATKFLLNFAAFLARLVYAYSNQQRLYFFRTFCNDMYIV